MILERCQTLSARIEEKKRLEQSVTQIRRFRKIRDIIIHHRDRLSPLLGVSQALQEAGVAAGETPEGVQSAFEAVEAARGVFRQSPESIIDPGEFAPVPFGQALTTAASGDCALNLTRPVWASVREPLGRNAAMPPTAPVSS